MTFLFVHVWTAHLLTHRDVFFNVIFSASTCLLIMIQLVYFHKCQNTKCCTFFCMLPFPVLAVIRRWYFTKNRPKRHIENECWVSVFTEKRLAAAREKLSGHSPVLYKLIKWVISVCWCLLISKWWVTLDLKQRAAKHRCQFSVFPNQFVSCDIFCFCDAILVEHRSWIIHDFFIKTPPFA